MVRVLSLLWTFVLALLITAVSFFYIKNGSERGFPFTFITEVGTKANGEIVFNINYWLLAFDIIIWWLLFSVIWIIIKNYILEIDG